MYKQYASREASSYSFWSDHWSNQDVQKQMQSAKNSELIPLFKKYLPKKGKILEAGCGQGIFVNALKELGYQIEGIDFDRKTVEQINNKFPDLKIATGDIFKLDYPDSSLEAYISLGVIEHYEDSWRQPLQEAFRILKKGEIIMLSVPYYNLIRKLQLPLRRKGEFFYQYFFNQKEIVEAVKKSGFEVIDIEFYGKTKTLVSLPLVGRFLEKTRRQITDLREKSKSGLFLSQEKKKSIYKKAVGLLPKSILAHMIMIIARKK